MNFKHEKLKVVALGGCGGMGQFAVRTALSYDFIDEIIIADRDGKRADDFAGICNKNNVRAVEIDIMDSQKLHKLLDEADVVMTAVGPYYRFGVPILRAAIATGCHYLDLNDDWEPTLEMLNLDEEAQKAGICAIIGVGASPGISNMLAVKAMNMLDSVDSLITAWGSGGNNLMTLWKTAKASAGGSYGAAIEHAMQQLTGTIRLLVDGQFKDVKPFEQIVIDYPGIGKVTAYTIGHPEPLTIPLFRPEMKYSCNAMNLPAVIVEFFRWIACEIDAGRMNNRDGAVLMTQMESDLRKAVLSPNYWKCMFNMMLKCFNLKEQFLYRMVRDFTIPEAYLPELCAIANGKKNGTTKKVAVSMSSTLTGGSDIGSMGALTGIPMAVGLALIAKGKVSRLGVFAPEKGIDPDDFFDELASLCTPSRRDAGELLTIDISN
ncbi:MAG: saccharopine dehydrogenase NADP-binding domain-containing protein [Desulfamplus sp.]|nr:saccharopine dehydrogenase NADP-binding domain-containing protein [Desulfamplus sp.]